MCDGTLNGQPRREGGSQDVGHVFKTLEEAYANKESLTSLETECYAMLM